MEESPMKKPKVHVHYQEGVSEGQEEAVQEETINDSIADQSSAKLALLAHANGVIAIVFVGGNNNDVEIGRFNPRFTHQYFANGRLPGIPATVASDRSIEIFISTISLTTVKVVFSGSFSSENVVSISKLLSKAISSETLIFHGETQVANTFGCSQDQAPNVVPGRSVHEFIRNNFVYSVNLCNHNDSAAIAFSKRFACVYEWFYESTVDIESGESRDNYEVLFLTRKPLNSASEIMEFVGIVSVESHRSPFVGCKLIVPWFFVLPSFIDEGCDSSLLQFVYYLAKSREDVSVVEVVIDENVCDDYLRRLRDATDISYALEYVEKHHSFHADKHLSVLNTVHMNTESNTDLSSDQIEEKITKKSDFFNRLEHVSKLEGRVLANNLKLVVNQAVFILECFELFLMFENENNETEYSLSEFLDRLKIEEESVFLDLLGDTEDENEEDKWERLRATVVRRLYKEYPDLKQCSKHTRHIEINRMMDVELMRFERGLQVIREKTADLV